MDQLPRRSNYSTYAHLFLACGRGQKYPPCWPVRTLYLQWSIRSDIPCWVSFHNKDNALSLEIMFPVTKTSEYGSKLTEVVECRKKSTQQLVWFLGRFDGDLDDLRRQLPILDPSCLNFIELFSADLRCSNLLFEVYLPPLGTDRKPLVFRHFACPVFLWCSLLVGWVESDNCLLVYVGRMRNTVWSLNPQSFIF